MINMKQFKYLHRERIYINIFVSQVYRDVYIFLENIIFFFIFTRMADKEILTHIARDKTTYTKGHKHIFQYRYTCV